MLGIELTMISHTKPVQSSFEGCVISGE